MPDTTQTLAADHLAKQLHEAARAGDWDRLDELADCLPSQPPPDSDARLMEYLFELRATVIAARTTRADIVKSLHRLSAAVGFGASGTDHQD